MALVVAAAVVVVVLLVGFGIAALTPLDPPRPRHRSTSRHRDDVPS